MEEGKDIRKSNFRNYYMIPKEAAPVMVYVGKRHPAAMKVLLYMLNNMGSLNELDNTDYKKIRAAYSFVSETDGQTREKSITVGTISRAVGDLKEMEIIDADQRLKREKREKFQDKQKEKEKKVLYESGQKTFHTYVVNPKLAWTSHLENMEKCKFTRSPFEFNMLLEKHNPKKDLAQNRRDYNKSMDWKSLKDGGSALAKQMDRTIRAKEYFMINRAYAKHFYWIAQENSLTIPVFFYLMQNMNQINEVNARENKGMGAISAYLGLSRAPVSKAINLLNRYHFIEIEKDGQYNTYILNPELVWASEKENLSKCKFPKNLAVNTPCDWQRKRMVDEDENEQMIADQEMLKDLVTYLLKSSKLDEDEKLIERFKMQNQMQEELQLLRNNYKDSLFLQLGMQIAKEE